MYPEKPQEQLDHNAAEQAGVVGHVALLEAERLATEWTADKQVETEAALQRSLGDIGQHVPEVVEEAERIAQGATELIRTFEVEPAFFEDAKRTTIFASLALSTTRMHEARNADPTNEQELDRQQAFISNATFLLTRKHASAFRDLDKQHESAKGNTDEGHLKRTLDKYEQPELTHALSEYIEHNDVLTDLRDKFATDPSSGADPDIHVLGIAHNPLIYLDHPSNDLTRTEEQQWSAGLEERTKLFAAEFPQGELASRADGFAVDFDEGTKHHVYIPMTGAELVMAEERGITPSGYAVQARMAERVTGTIRHEYVHTKGGVNVGDTFGKSLEERRAEYHSGDTGEYYEVKTFFRHLQLLNGRYVGDMFDEVVGHQEDEHPISIYEVLARDFGLGSVAEIAAAHPSVYAMYAKSPVTKAMMQTLGGFDGIVERAVHNGYVDQDAARAYTARVINNFRADKAGPDGELDADHEEFLGSYFGPVLRGLNMHLPDIPYEPREPRPEVSEDK